MKATIDWVKVEDRLPEAEGDYLVWPAWPSGKYRTVRIYAFLGESWFTGGSPARVPLWWAVLPGDPALLPPDDTRERLEKDRAMRARLLEELEKDHVRKPKCDSCNDEGRVYVVSEQRYRGCWYCNQGSM